MHRLGLLSGLRPGNLVAIERAWLRLDAGAVDFPARVMKNRQPFALPLSAPMVAIVREALGAGDVLASGTPWRRRQRSTVCSDVSGRRRGQYWNAVAAHDRSVTIVAECP